MQMGQSVTHAAIQPTHSPSWEELLLIEVEEDEFKDEGLSTKWCKCYMSIDVHLQHLHVNHVMKQIFHFCVPVLDYNGGTCSRLVKSF